MRKTIALGMFSTALVVAACGDDDVQELEVFDFVDVFDVCSVDAQCPLGTFCLDVSADYGDVVVFDATCTVACDVDLDCPLGGFCFDTFDGPPVCHEPCFDDLDCPIGFGCLEDVTGVFACFPV